MNAGVQVSIARVASLALLFAASAVARGACAQIVRVEGASAGSEVVRIAAEQFLKTKKGTVRVTTGISGSGESLRKLCGDKIDIVNASRPISQEELAACQRTGMEFIEIPVAFDAVTVVVNSRNAFVSALSPAELKKMWEASAQGKVVRWSQINPGFPGAPLKLLGPDSQYERASTFTEVILGQGQAARRDYMTSIDDGMLVQGVARDVNALAYLSYPIFLENRSKLKAVPIVPEHGGPALSPSPESIVSGAYALSRPLFLYVNRKSLDKTPVRDFAEFAISNGSWLAGEARYVPLSDGVYRLGLAHLRNRSTGTAWSGSIPTGVTPREVERRLATL
jgi:phosphate transport system substrate-binding protein